MWIPYDLKGPLKADTSPETIAAAGMDRKLRQIMVGFFLRNPVTWTWEIDLCAQDFADGIETQLEGQPARIDLHGDDTGRVEEIVYRTFGTDHLAVLSRCHRDLEARLARWALELGRGMSIAGWRVADPDNNARWRCTPFRPSALNLSPERAVPPSPEFLPLLNLYRQGRNSSDPAWRLITATAILTAWRDGCPPLDRRQMPPQTVSLQMLVLSGTLVELAGLQDQPLETLVELLVQERDAQMAALAHPTRISSVGLAAQARLAQLANIADLAARQVLLVQMQQAESVAERSAIDGCPIN